VISLKCNTIPVGNSLVLMGIEGLILSQRCTDRSIFLEMNRITKSVCRVQDLRSWRDSFPEPGNI